MAPHGFNFFHNNENEKDKKDNTNNDENGLLESFVDEMEREDNTNFFHHMIAGSVAGMSEHFLLYPFDVLKTRIYHGRGKRVFKVLRRIIRQEGAFTLLKGVHIALLGSIPSHAMLFSTYELSKKYFPKNNFFIGISGLTATMAHDLVANFFLTIRTRVILGSKQSGINIFKNILFNEGLRAFLISYPFSVLMNIPFVTTYFISYEVLKKRFIDKFSNNKNSNFASLIAGGLAGGLAGYISSPFDILKIRLMDKNRGVKGEFFSIYKKGFRGFFRGATARALYYLPSGAVTWYAFETTKNFLNSLQKKKIDY